MVQEWQCGTYFGIILFEYFLDTGMDILEREHCVMMPMVEFVLV